MKRASTLLTWWYLAVGGALAAAAVTAPDEQWRVVLYSLTVVATLAAVVRAHHRNELTPPLTVTSIVAVLGFALSRLLPGDSVPSTHLAAVVAGIVGYGAAALGLLIVLHRRGVDLRDGLRGDAVIIALATWVVSWTALTQPIIEREGVTAATLLHAVHLPVAAVMLFFAVTLLLDERNRNVAAGLIAAALALQVLADLVDDLMDAGHLVGGFERLALGFAIAASLCAGGGYLHPSLVAMGQETTHASRSAVGRLVVTIGSLVFPVVVLGATSATGTADKVVRTISAVALAAAVTLRVLQAMRASTASKAALLQDAQSDPLTGLPNRQVLLQEITNLLGVSWADEQYPTLFFVDLDRFKKINDSLGHAAGDEVLVTVAERLHSAMPPNATVARISGDEYAILDPNPTSHDDAMALADELLALVREPLALSHGDVFITASVGVAAISNTTSMSPEDLVRLADTAMYRAKERGRNCAEAYDASMQEKLAHSMELQNALHRAIERNELRLYHQPILDLHTGEVAGFEALMRWQQSDGSIVSPAEFIPLAEETGSIVEIGAWALLEALTQLQRWIEDGVCSPTATMSVNVSARQLDDPKFPDVVEEAIRRSGVPPQLLWLEITETVMIGEHELALATLRNLRTLGVRMALDDFGTKYSSLSLLQKFPLQRLKIDRAFVRGLADNPNDRGLVRTIIAMGSSLGLDIVAEGVESVQQLQVLVDLGCGKAQGYLISHPLPADAMRSTVAALERLGEFPGLRPNVTAP